MITFIKDDIFKSDCDAITNTINTVGVMGKGLALQFKYKYPTMFYEYNKLCKNKELLPGKVWVWKDDKYIFNFATKEHWRNPSRYEWIATGLYDTNEKMKIFKIESIAIPALGCSNGGLDWKIVKQYIEKTHDLFWQEKRIVVYEPF